MKMIVRYVLADLIRSVFRIRTKPRVLQLPVTSKCNSRCLTCNVWKHLDKNDIDPQALAKSLDDPYFSKLKTIGLNGGEISLYRDYEALFDAILKVKSLQSIHIISNGLHTKRLLKILCYAKARCAKQNILLGVTISIDGVYGCHDTVRGIKGAYEKTINSFRDICEHKEIYCDYLEIGCTISKYNVGQLAAMEAEFAQYNVPILYHLAVPNKRIHTFNNSDYSVLNDNRSRILAAEFFFGHFIFAPTKLERFRSFANYYYLIHKGRGRLASCDWLRRDVTIDEKMNFCLCATASDVIANLTQTDVSSLLNAGEIRKMENKIESLCNSCIHYNSLPSFKGLFIFFYYYLIETYTWKYKFKFKVRWYR